MENVLPLAMDFEVGKLQLDALLCV